MRFEKGPPQLPTIQMLGKYEQERAANNAPPLFAFHTTVANLVAIGGGGFIPGKQLSQFIRTERERGVGTHMPTLASTELGHHQPCTTTSTLAAAAKTCLCFLN